MRLCPDCGLKRLRTEGGFSEVTGKMVHSTWCDYCMGYEGWDGK